MRSRTAMTLIELVVVLTVLAALSGLLIPLFTGTIQSANGVATQRTLVEVRDALMEYWRDTKHIGMDGIATTATEANRLHVDWLYKNPVTGDSTWGFNPSTRLGWRGPYISNVTSLPTAPGYPFLIDAWNRPVVVQDVNASAALRDVRIVSGGPNGVINIPAATPTSSLTPTNIGDDVYVAITLR